MALRPIFLTTLTTVAGLIPTAYGFIGGLDSFVSPMIVVWGLIVVLPRCSSSFRWAIPSLKMCRRGLRASFHKGEGGDSCLRCLKLYSGATSSIRFTHVN